MYTHKDAGTHRDTEKQTWPDRQIDRQKCTDTDRQTDTNTNAHKYKYKDTHSHTCSINTHTGIRAVELT